MRWRKLSMTLVAVAFCLLAAQRAEAGAYTTANIYYDEGCDCVYGNAHMYADYYYGDGIYYYPQLNVTMYGPAGYTGGYDSGSGETNQAHLSVDFLIIYNLSNYGDGEYEIAAESYMYYDGPSSSYDPLNLSYWARFFIYAPNFFDFYDGPERGNQPVGRLGTVYDKKNVKFPKPVNFRVASVFASADGAHLIFNYAWDSSTGQVSDLGRCTVDEYVVYLDSGHTANGVYHPPNPPWPAGASFANPFDSEDSGAQLGGIEDRNGFEQANFVKPYSVAEINANQWIRWRCPYINQGQTQNFTGQINILSAIYPKDSSATSWYYTVQKSGWQSNIDPLP